MLEVFNTLLRQLRLSVDYELTGSYDGSTNIGTKIIKAHEERQLQEAVIRTIGETAGGVSETETERKRESVSVCGRRISDRPLSCDSLYCLCLCSYLFIY